MNYTQTLYQQLTQHVTNPNAKLALDCLLVAAAVVGAAQVLSAGQRFSSFFWRHSLRGLLQSRTWLYDQYGSPNRKSWAVVTGGSDGIGLQMAHQLAAQGFSICIVARNAEKMDGCLREIKAKCKDSNPEC